MGNSRFKITKRFIIDKYLIEGQNLLVILKIAGTAKAEKSRIISIVADSFVMDAPFLAYSPDIVSKNVSLKIRIFPEDGFYVEFISVVVERFYDGEDCYLKMSYPPQILRVQRRDDFRVPVDLSALFMVLGELSEKKDVNLQEEVSILNLSLGGALIASNNFYKEDSRCSLSFRTSEYLEGFKFIGRITRLKQIESQKSKFRFHFGFKFNVILEISIMQALSKYITAEQLKHLSAR